ncbi:Nuclear poly(A) polymerase 4 [Camellia lanceoleosa]|uniref:Nuclear poly(A) polymerase 4 n=1 Tax=Camellia lanceoleosa TaxID=1840588 RepID=A0ACC0FNZ6_9ERIC|nr:Nuclear poly(A) polymerase 4 [Camellia lanceoleosa]
MEEVTEPQPVPDAHVLVMKFKYQGISIDLVYASISQLIVPEDLDISDGSVLDNIDEQTVRSLNGCRVVDQILKLVPNVERKQGVKVEEGQQFDIHGTVDKFKQDVNMYMFWKPGMDIYVSHVRRKQIPSYVFPDGYKRSQLLRHANQQSERTSEEDAEGCRFHSAKKQLKRKKDSETVNSKTDKPEKRASISPLRPWSVPPESCTSRFGVASQASCSGEVKLEPLVAGDADSNPEVRPSAVVDYSETGYTKRVLNRKEGADDDNGELVKPCKHFARAENDRSAPGSNICVLNLSCTGNACAVDLDSHLENGCLNGSRLFENSVAETLEVESEINSIKFGSQVVL